MKPPNHVFETSDRSIRIAVYGPVFAGVYESPLTAKGFAEVLEWQPKAMPKDDKIISFSLAFGVHRLAPDTKDAADRLLAKFGAQTRAAVNVLVAEGFQASAARAMLSTIFLLTKVSYPRKVVANVGEGRDWLDTTVGPNEDLAAATKWLLAEEAKGPRDPAAVR